MFKPFLMGRQVIVALRQDVAYAVRTLSRARGMVAAIIVTLGLGVGANAAVFTALDRVFFRAPSGIQEPLTLRRLYARQLSSRAPEFGPEGRVTPFITTRDLLDLEASTRGVARIEADYLHRRGRAMPDSQRVLLSFVSPGYFDMLGVRMQRGRAFAPDEARLPGPPTPVAIISDGFWQSRFARDPAILGKSVRIDETTFTIIGVASPDFEGLELESIDLWAPLASGPGAGDITSLRAVMRLEHDVDPASVERRLSAQYRETHAGDRLIGAGSEIIAASILPARGPSLSGVSVRRIPNMSERSISLLGRLGVIGILVLVLAILNVQGLLLMRAIRRRREIAMRLALGVSRVRLAGLLVTESVLLALVAGTAALGAAALTGGLLRAQLAAGIRWTFTVVDGRVVLFTVIAAVAAGCISGIAPAMFALRTDVAASLKAGMGGGRAGSAMRAALLVAQAALCMALLMGAGVILQSLRRAGEADRGFDAVRTVLVTVPAYYAGAEVDLARVSTAIRAMPGVEAVGRSLTGLIATGFRTKVGLSASDTVGEGPQGPWVDFVDANWGRAAGVRLLGGRMLDSLSSLGPVAVVNESLARALYRGRNIAGTCIRVREPAGVCRQVIGVVRDVRWDPSEPPMQRVYLPLVQAWTRPPAALIPNYLVVRTQAPTHATDVARMRAVMADLTPRHGEVTVQRVTDMLEPQLRPWRLAATLFLILGGLGLVAAVTGVYGLVASDVTERTRELGIRLALGAPRIQVLRLVVASALRVVMLGALAGTIVALIVGRVMAALLYATSPYDPVVLVGTAAMLAIAALAASLFPAWHATRLSPMAALRAD